jgi:hypothetical protein
MRPSVMDIDVNTGEWIFREMTDEEFADYEARYSEIRADQAE